MAGMLLMLVVIIGSIQKGNAEAETPLIELSHEEAEFIKRNPEIRIGIDPRFVPFEFVDASGNYQGIAADYLQMISERTGITFIMDPSLTWREAYQKAVDREIDMLPSVGRTAERETYFLFSDAYYTFDRVIVVERKNETIEQLGDLFQKSVAVQVNSSHHGFLGQYESIEPVLYQTVEEALAAVNRGSETAFIGNLATVSYLSRQLGFTELKYIPVEMGERQFLHMAIRNDWPELHQIINKALATITDEERMTINSRWVGLEQQIDYSDIIRNVMAVVVAALLITGVSFFWIVRLRKEIAEKNIIQQELKLAKEEAESANQVKSMFLARMSHEIRTPLNAITGLTYLMKKSDVTTTQKMHLDKIAEASRTMLSIVNDILDFAKIEAGKIDIEHISFDVDQVLQEVVNLVTHQIREKKIAFHLNRDPRLPIYFHGDPTRVEQILLNVVNNAVKFTDTGEIAMSVRSVAVREDTHYIEFSVKDTGIGMDEEQVTRLFTPFDQADVTITRRYGGTGLGLSIVRHLVDLMKGEIKVYSSPGEGTTFLITIPMTEDREKAFEEKQRQASLYFKDLRVLVLEKNSQQRERLATYLEAFNLSAEFASSENQALQLVKSTDQKGHKPYNLLILDLDHLHKETADFTRRVIAEQPLGTPLKVMGFIPLDRDEIFDRLEDYGIDMGVGKPVIPSVLFNGILQLFNDQVMTKHRNAMAPGSESVQRLQAPAHALVVEDNRTNQLIAKSILEEAGFTVSVAENGLEGLQMYRKMADAVDVILMDLHMPVMNGLDAAALIRKENEQVPMIAMTADAITGVEEKCRQAGMAYYVSKPYDPPEFVKTVIMVLDKKEPSRQPETTGEDNPSSLDESDALQRIGNNRELYRLVLDSFQEENEGTAEMLKQQLEAEDTEAAVQTIHKIKSSAGNIGAIELRKSAAALQDALTGGENDEWNPLAHQFIIELARVLAEIQVKLQRHQEPLVKTDAPVTNDSVEEADRNT
ncbi:ATP-binding protein [Anoxynatronum buryatiense]|uniref:Circadian input-output histidine kinase CikA n=1 Tax=Anoxynatronum buryatiense TaxID=489973 RepID=A0AA45WWU2_9CLOT|nr:transporter substrate-binding domain-containing protein [Anoxynatronum buryatiense]SMP61434.1 Signal transduction histidine kinase [Anoxynatronum buryatiense]